MSNTNQTESVEQAITRVGNAVEVLRNARYPAFDFPVKAEFTNWRSEQLAWRESCVLFDQSHHMSNFFLSGPDAVSFLEYYGVNSFANFEPGRAKQYVAVNAEGYYIGDGILFYLPDGRIDLVANATIINWLQYHVESGDYDVEFERDDNSSQRSGPPRLFRYELQGPNALALVEKLTGKPVPEVKFFHMIDLEIAGQVVHALRHGMAGQPGFELFADWKYSDQTLDAILTAGEEFGLVRAGGKAYSTANLESGWVPRPPAAVFGDNERAYREWLPASSIGSMGGSMDSADIRDFYLTPFDLGYGHIVKFDHDFHGREALEKLASADHRKKVTLLWNPEDVASVFRSQLEPGLPAKYMELPKARYAFFHTDKVEVDGKWVGISTDVGYVANEHAFISLACIDASVAEVGNEVTVLWGESPNTAKPAVEPHRQVPIRATVAPIPFGQEVRNAYRRA